MKLVPSLPQKRALACEFKCMHPVHYCEKICDLDEVKPQQPQGDTNEQKKS